MNARKLLAAIMANVPGHNVALFLADNGALSVSIVEPGERPLGVVRFDDGDEDRDVEEMAREIAANYTQGIAAHYAALAANEATS